VFLGLSVPQRAREFAAGRLCARRALAEFGMEEFPIERAADRQPIWPPGIGGSITHTAGFCAAVAARRETTTAIGLDTETVGGTAPRRASQSGAPPGISALGRTPPGGVKPHLWPSICVAAELEWLESLPEPQRVPAATLIFSAKEAFDKCQYPLTRQHLGFHDACIELREWNEESGRFFLSSSRSIEFAAHAPLPITGRYAFHGDWVSAGVFAAAGGADGAV
jgi:4'-phosphopantetheinyl transferase EntD